MVKGIFEPDDAVREGWARDPDDEISIDGYNAFIQITTNDGTTGFSITEATGAVVFSAKSTGDGYVARNLGIGKNNPTEALDVAGTAKVENLQVTNGATSGYVLTSDTQGSASWQPPADVLLDGYLDSEDHRDLDQLVHDIAETSFEEITYSDNKVSNITIWTNSGKTTKIREQQFVYSGNKVSTITSIQYDSGGLTAETLTETYTYSGNRVANIDRILT